MSGSKQRELARARREISNALQAIMVASEQMTGVRGALIESVQLIEAGDPKSARDAIDILRGIAGRLGSAKPSEPKDDAARLADFHLAMKAAMEDLGMKACAVVQVPAHDKNGWSALQFVGDVNLSQVVAKRMGVKTKSQVPDAPVSDAPLKERMCFGCGCTETSACVGGCSWVSAKEDVCTRCRAKGIR